MKLFPTHVPTTAAQKALLGVSSAFLGLLDPRRARDVACLAEVTGERALRHLRRRLAATVEGRRLLTERPRLADSINLAHLRTLPAESLGASYAAFMDANSLDPFSRPPVRFVDDAELAYLMERYRAVHDVFHVLLGFDNVTVEGEVHLKLAEALVTGLPMTMLAAAVGPLRLSWSARRELISNVLPWAVQSCSPALLACIYEERWEEDLDQVRSSLGIRSRQ